MVLGSWRESHTSHNTQLPMRRLTVIFLLPSASYEEDLAESHTIVPNGYNFGRDWLVGNATGHAIPYPSNLHPLSTSPTGPLNADGGTGVIQNVPNGLFTGTTSFDGYMYQTTVQYVSGLMGATSVGINHNTTVPEGGQLAIDGMVAVFTVSIVSS